MNGIANFFVPHVDKHRRLLAAVLESICALTAEQPVLNIYEITTIRWARHRSR